MWTNSEIQKYAMLARSGNVKAQVYLGWAYIEGKYVQINYSEGLKLLQLAGDSGSVEAKYRYGLVLIYNNDEEGFGELLSLSKYGYLPATYDLGNCYFMGKMVTRNSSEALTCWKIAGEGGHLLAMLKYIKIVEARSSPLKRLLFGIKYLFYSINAIIVMAKNPNDERVLGTL